MRSGCQMFPYACLRARPCYPFRRPIFQVNGLQQQLALVNASPLLGLPEAAELLADNLDVDLVA
jgi:hypothetical protein